MTVRLASAFLAGLYTASCVWLLSDQVGQASPVAATDVLLLRHASRDLDQRIKTFVVDPADDAAKSGSVHGIMGWRFFEIPAGTTDPSDRQLRFKFTAPAEIRQIDVSVDIGDPRLTLVEFAVGINTFAGYGLSRATDWLLHTSWSRMSADAGRIDETAVLPRGVEVDAGDSVGVVAWLGGRGRGDPLRVSPEVVVLYRWLDDD